MKIALIANDTTYVYNLRDELMQTIIAKGHSLVVVCDKGDHADDLVAMGVKLVELSVDRRGKNPLNDLKLMLTYNKILKEEKPDLVLTFNIKPDVYAGLACHHRKIPFLPNITGLGAVGYPGLMTKIIIELYKFSIKNAYCVFFQNSDNIKFFEDMGIKCQRKVLLPGSGVNVSKYIPIEYPVGKEFCFIGRILKEKGIEEYVTAAKNVLKEHPDAVFHIIGGCDGNYEDYLAEAVQTPGIIYHGHSSCVGDFIARCCCTLHPTYYPEGMSNVLLESGAIARPIITTDQCGCREIVDDGVNGFVVKQRDSADLTEKILKFLALPWDVRKDMGLAGRAKIEKEFDRRIVVDKYMTVINEVFDGKEG